MDNAWKPIATAPKDGTPILGCYAEHYTSDGYSPITVKWQPYLRPGSGAWHKLDGCCVLFISHWMPLPPPPAEGSQKTKESMS